MSDPISDLKHELLAAAVRQHSHAATGREWTREPSRWRWVIVAVAVVILVGGLLVTPAFGIGDRLLSLIQGTPSPGEVQTPAWSPDGRRLAFVSGRREGAFNPELWVAAADGSGQRRVQPANAADGSETWPTSLRPGRRTGTGCSTSAAATCGSSTRTAPAQST